MTTKPINQYFPELASELRISGIQLDSRLVQPGDLFVAVKGAKLDGMSFVADAERKGAVAVLTNSDSQAASDLPVIQVQQNFTQVLSRLAADFYDQPSQQVFVLAVTGTNGKTSTCQFIAQIFDLLHQRSAYIGTNGQGIWPELAPVDNTTLDIVRNQQVLKHFVAGGARYCAMEVSSHGLDQQRVKGITFGCAVFTNLTRDHLDYHLTLDAYGEAKKKLFTDYGIKKAVINFDEALGQEILKLGHLNSLSYSLLDHQADLYVSDIEFQAHGLSFKLHFQGQQYAVQAGLLGRFNIANLLAAVGAVMQAGYTLQDIVSVLPRLTPVKGRMEAVAESLQKAVSIDYAHTPDALEKALLAMRDHCNGQLWVVFGCGGDRDKGKRPLMAQVAEQLADRIVVTDDNPRTELSADIMADIRTGFSNETDNRVTFIGNRKQAIRHALDGAKAGDSILIAGKGHEDYQIIGTTKSHFSDYEVVVEALSEVRP